MILSILKGLVFILSASAFISLTSAIIEARVQRSLRKDPDYLLAISILKALCWIGLLVAVFMTTNYVWRFFTGLTGSLLPGPQINSVVSLASLSAAFLLLTVMGVVLLWLLWQSYDPSEEELQRRRRIIDAQARTESNRIKERGEQR